MLTTMSASSNTNSLIEKEIDDEDMLSPIKSNNLVVRVNQDTDDNLQALFDSVLNPGDAKRPLQLPLRMRKLPNSFFTPRRPRTRGPTAPTPPTTRAPSRASTSGTRRPSSSSQMASRPSPPSPSSRFSRLPSTAAWRYITPEPAAAPPRCSRTTMCAPGATQQQPTIRMPIRAANSSPLGPLSQRTVPKSSPAAPRPARPLIWTP